MPKISEIVAKKDEILQFANSLGFDAVSVAKSTEENEDPYVFIIDTKIEAGPILASNIKKLETSLKNEFEDYGIIVDERNVLKIMEKEFNDDLSKYYLCNNVNLDRIFNEQSFNEEIEKTIMQEKC